MKLLTMMATLLFSAAAMAQPPATKKIDASKKVVVETKVQTIPAKGSGKLDATRFSTKPSSAYKVNHRLREILAYLPAQTTMVGGKKITSRMVAVDRPGLTSVRGKTAGISQRIKEGNRSENADKICQTYTVKVSANSENFDVPYGTQASHIYPGATYMYEEYYKNTVSPKTITAAKNPLYIQASSSSGNGKFELVEDPTQVNLNAAAGRIKNSLPATATNESTSISMVSLYDESDFFLKVNGGGGGFGFKADASFGIATNSKKSYFLIDAVQTFFTLNAIRPEGDTAGFFKDPANNSIRGAMFMASVSYGRRVLGVLETEFKDEKMMASFKASYTAGFAGGYAGLDMMNGMNSQSTKVKLYFVGGNAASIEVPNATEASVRNVINNYLRATTTQNAVPVKFTFRDMSMSGMRYESATDNFTYEQCVPVIPELKYNVKVELLSIDNSKQEEVKFGLHQAADLYIRNQRIVLPGYETAPLLSWREMGEPFKSLWKSEPPRNFTRSTMVNRVQSFVVTQADMNEGNAKVELFTSYIAMYATKVFGKTNDSNPKKKETVFLRDVITSGGGSLRKDIQINFNGRVFTIHFIITANPI